VEAVLPGGAVVGATDAALGSIPNVVTTDDEDDEDDGADVTGLTTDDEGDGDDVTGPAVRAVDDGALTASRKRSTASAVGTARASSRKNHTRATAITPTTTRATAARTGQYAATPRRRPTPRWASDIPAA
jgi:hypothetical protein